MRLWDVKLHFFPPLETWLIWEKSWWTEFVLSFTSRGGTSGLPYKEVAPLVSNIIELLRNIDCESRQILYIYLNRTRRSLLRQSNSRKISGREEVMNRRVAILSAPALWGRGNKSTLRKIRLLRLSSVLIWTMMRTTGSFVSEFYLSFSSYEGRCGRFWRFWAGSYLGIKLRV